MPERFYEQDPNTGQRYYTEKGWSEWKPVPVEKDPSTGEEYELWNEQWVKRSPMDEKPAEMPSLDKGGMAVAGSPNMAQKRLTEWAKLDPKRNVDIFNRAKDRKATPYELTELDLVMSGEKVTPGRVKRATESAQRAQAEGEKAKARQEAADTEYRGALASGTFQRIYKLLQGPMAENGKGETLTTGYAASGIAKGTAGFLDVSTSLADVATKILPERFGRAIKLARPFMDEPSNYLKRVADVATPSRVVGAMANSGWEKALAELPEGIFSQIPMIAGMGPLSQEAAASAVGKQVFRGLVKRGVKNTIAKGAAKAVAGSVATLPMSVGEGLQEWGSTTQDIRKAIIDRRVQEAESKGEAPDMPSIERDATAEALHQTRNMIAQNVALLTATSLVDPVSNLFGAKAVKDVAARQTKKGLAKKAFGLAGAAAKEYVGQYVEERGQTAFQIMAENGKAWSIDNFVEAWDTDEAKHAGRIGGMMGLAIGAGTGIVQKRMEAAAGKAQAEQAAQDAMLRAGAESLRAEVEAQQAQEQAV